MTEYLTAKCLKKDLKVIDAAAAALCRDNDMPVLIFDLGETAQT